MLFFWVIALVPAFFAAAIIWGAVSSWREHRRNQQVPYGQRMREAWAKAGVEYQGVGDPALPPPTPEQLRDLEAMEAFHMDHAVEMAVQQACERASSLFIHQNYTVEGARKEAARLIATPFAGVHGYKESKRIHERMEEMPVHLLLNDKAMAKLESDTNALREAWKKGGAEAAGKVATDLGYAQEPKPNSFAWMDDERRRVAGDLRNTGHSRTRYKRDRQTPTKPPEGHEGWVAPEDAPRTVV